MIKGGEREKWEKRKGPRGTFEMKPPRACRCYCYCCRLRLRTGCGFPLESSLFSYLASSPFIILSSSGTTMPVFVSLYALHLLFSRPRWSSLSLSLPPASFLCGLRIPLPPIYGLASRKARSRFLSSGVGIPINGL